MSFREALIAVQRFGLGARPGELREAAQDPRGWLRAQLRSPPLPAELRQRPPLAQAMRLGPAAIREAVEALRAESKDGAAPADAAASRRDAREALRHHMLAEDWARFMAAVQSSAPFHERLVRFWSNHFTVSAAHAAVAPIAGHFEREAIRPNLGARFSDLLQAATLHPAMLSYLDNDRSIGPNSPAGRKHGAGLNENLAREVLELHTLGVSGGYTQDDVMAFARTLSGWVIDTAAGAARFVPWRHEPGAHTVLGRRYDDEGDQQARHVLEDLAAHPSTARFIALKLARHFIADDPPASAVARLERAFRIGNGDLPTLHAALVELPEAWSAPLTKYRSPEEFMIAQQRLLGADGGARRPVALVGALGRQGQRPFMAPSPAGWPDTSAAWLSGDGLWKRVEMATAIAERVPASDPLALAHAAFADQADPELLSALRGAERPAQALALLLSSPQFNRR